MCEWCGHDHQLSLAAIAYLVGVNADAYRWRFRKRHSAHA